MVRMSLWDIPEITAKKRHFEIQKWGFDFGTGSALKDARLREARLRPTTRMRVVVDWCRAIDYLERSNAFARSVAFHNTYQS